jgi:hypothetical protein
MLWARRKRSLLAPSAGALNGYFFLSPTVARKNASQGTESGSSKFARRISASGFLSCA